MQAIFKKYDLRGIVGKQFNVSDAYNITKAIITCFQLKYPTLKNIAVGMDGRTSSEAIKIEVCNAIIDSGFNAYFIGLCTTPILYFACNTIDVDAGIMITASHNPKEYNGFKLVLQKESVWGDDITKIYNFYLTKQFCISPKKGSYYEYLMVDQYIDSLVNNFSHLMNANPNFVIDCGNGTAGVVIPKLIAKLNWSQVAILYPEVDGNYPNHEPNPVEPENMIAVKQYLTKHTTSAFGIGLDGDCDRVAAMTKTGYLIPGDLLLGIFALNIEPKYKPAAVMDAKCSDSIATTLKKYGIPCYLSPSGHAFIKSYLKQHNAMIGGELSGHFCFKDRHFGFDDGIYAMLRLCEILIQSNQTLDHFISLFPKAYCSPEFRIACTEEQKDLIVKSARQACALWPNAKIIALDGVRVQTDGGWALVRAANTEPAISIRIEGYSMQALQKLKLDLFEIIVKHIDRNELAAKMDL